MIRVLFVCHGNICRSPMAEYVFQSLIEAKGAAGRFTAASAATSREEIGNDVYPPARRKLTAEGIPCPSRKARQMTKADYEFYDYILIMDENNRRNALRLLGGDPAGKLHKLLDFTDAPGDIADPWYTGDFDAAYEDIRKGCQGLLQALLKAGA